MRRVSFSLLFGFLMTEAAFSVNISQITEKDCSQIPQDMTLEDVQKEISNVRRTFCGSSLNEECRKQLTHLGKIQRCLMLKK